MLAALAEAGRRLDRADYSTRRRARRVPARPALRRRAAAPHLARRRREGHGLSRGLRERRARALRAARRDGRPRWLHESRRLALLAVELFADDANGGFFLTPVDGEALVARQKDLDDNPTPSGNSMLAFVLLRLARLWGDDELERRAVGVLRLVRDAIPRAPQAFGWALCALDLHLSPPREVAIVGDPASPVARAALAGFGANAVVAFGPGDGVPLLEGKDLVGGGGRLRLRAICLPSAGNGSGASCR